VQKWTVVVFAAVMALFIGVVLLEGGERAAPESTVDAGLDGAPAADGESPVSDAGDAPDGEPGSISEGPRVDAGGTLLNGEAPPALGPDAPKTVVFGVILVQYKGAQGALPNTRSREDALKLAQELAVEAKADFKAAVAKGDKGSMENAGKLGRGFIEPAPEFVLFNLPKGEVSEPVDTPRGFWIVHRIE
jgi:hypothetical protein